MGELERLLEDTSRTFALSIPFLPDPTRREVTVAYLLFRVADTFEDAWRWARPRRIAALETLDALLEGPDPEAARSAGERWSREVPVDHEGYRDLLLRTPLVLDRFFELADGSREAVRHHIGRTIRGMADSVARTREDGTLRLDGLPDLRRYCYIVAGIVGELLTDLFLRERQQLRGVEAYLRERAARFGEGLQLVNILKDSETDAREGRIYLPPDVSRSRVFKLAREDLVAATEYTLALQRAGAPRGIVAFNALPVRLAWATLEVVEDRGPGAKIGRARVWDIVRDLQSSLDDGRPAAAVPAGGVAP